LVLASKKWECAVMSKRELIDRIMKLNLSARREFLQCFTENELADYLHQLESIQTDAEDELAAFTSNKYALT
jgi:hypothetical protein